LQIEVTLAVGVAVGEVFTVTFTLSTFVQVALVTVTIYVVVVVGLTLGFAVVPAPPDHAYVNEPEPPLAVGDPPNVVAVPEQIVRAFPATATNGLVPVTVTDIEPVAVHEFASVTVTL